MNSNDQSLAVSREGGSPKGGYQSIQTLRAVAALFVVFVHMLYLYDSSLPYLKEAGPRMSGFYYWKGFGSSGVGIFFVISGFIMAYLHSIGETETFRDFALRRLTRIVPLYWIVTLFWILVLAAPGSVTSAKVFYSLLFVPPPDNTPIVAPGWTLNFEMFFYLLFGVTTLVLRRSILWIGVVFLVLNMAHSITGHYLPGLYSDPVVWNFLGGIVIFHIHRSPTVRQEATALFAVGVGLLLSTIFWHPADGPKGVHQFLPWGVPSMLTVLGAVAMDAEGKGRLLFRSRILLSIGDASYALYLIHTLTFVGIHYQILSKLRPQHLVTPDGAVFILLALDCAIAMAVHRWIEKPSIRLARRLTKGLRGETGLSRVAA